MSGNKFIEDNLNTIILGDCLDVMKQIPDKSIDLVLTDPPYNASNSNIGLKNGYKTINESWDKGFNPIYFLDIVKDKIKNGGSLIVFCSYHLLGEYLNWDGLKLQQIVHWEYITALPAIAKVYTPVIEYAVWFSTKNYTFNKKYSGTNIIRNKKAYQIDGKHINHPSIKPTNLIEKMLNVHSNQSDLILDCFSGSGTTAIACSKLKRNFICIEKDPDYYEASVKRLEDFKRQGVLF